MYRPIAGRRASAATIKPARTWVSTSDPSIRFIASVTISSPWRRPSTTACAYGPIWYRGQRPPLDRAHLSRISRIRRTVVTVSKPRCA